MDNHTEVKKEEDKNLEMVMTTDSSKIEMIEGGFDDMEEEKSIDCTTDNLTGRSEI